MLLTLFSVSLLLSLFGTARLKLALACQHSGPGLLKVLGRVSRVCAGMAVAQNRGQRLFMTDCSFQTEMTGRQSSLPLPYPKRRQPQHLT